MPGPLGATVTYCRRCEPLLLRRTPDDETENVHRLFSQLAPAPDGPGWLWTGKTNEHGYGLLVPVGGNSRHEWLAHRVMYGLLSPIGGHRLTEQLDHRDGNRANVAIWNLEPVSKAENLRRRGGAPRAPLRRMWSRHAALRAYSYELPVPVGFPTLIDYITADFETGTHLADKTALVTPMAA